ncbi:MAG: ABC transporter permease [Thermomicrobia bacterium]|nr:ABC transporter permease [Thermomicrobia bacterium]MCA1723089.1 ABC transporter permease [Thermomicrobia bacterium]
MSAAPAHPTIAAPPAVALEGLAALPKARSLWSDAWRQFRRHKLAMLGTVVVTILVLMTVVGPFVWKTPIDTIDFAASKAAPSLRHPMGTNDLGQDLLARIIWGGRISLAVGVVAMLVSITVGVVVGALAGFFGRATDSILMRFTDLFLALPTLPLLLLVVYLFRDTMRAAFGPIMGVFLIIVLVIGGLNWMPTARLVRAEFLSVKEKEFVEAARAMGAQNGSIIVKHILPNVLSPVIVAASLGVGAAIIAESTLSFLGIGFEPDVPTWGRLLSESRDFLDIAWWMAVGPGMMIFLTVLSINFIGDGLRDALDPRKTQG